MENTRHRWTDFPGHLLPLITKHLENRTEILSVRAVCTSFFSSVPLPPNPISPHAELKIPLVGFVIRFSTPNPNLYGIEKLLLTESTIYVIQPLNKISNGHQTTKSWFIRVEEARSGKVHVRDPFYGIGFRNLSEKLPKYLNLLDYRVTEVSKVYGMKKSASVAGDQSNDLNRFRYPFFRKVVVSSGLEEIKDGFMVVALHMRGVLGMWRKGDEAWTKIDVGQDISFEDVIFHHGKFYAVTCKGVIMAIDSVSLNVTEVSAPTGYSDHKYLVKSSKDMYLVEKHISDYNVKFGDEYFGYFLYDDKNRSVRLDVFKLDIENGRWLNVKKSLENGVLFCSPDCSFAVSAKEFPGLKGNCVYFDDESLPEERDWDHPGWAGGILDLDNDTIGPLSDFPGYSKIFWPPPTWLKQNH